MLQSQMDSPYIKVLKLLKAERKGALLKLGITYRSTPRLHMATAESKDPGKCQVEI